MPMLTMLRMRLPLWPSQAPLRTRAAKSAMRSSTSCTPGTTLTPSTRMSAPRGARSATCSTARFSVVLMRSPQNIASMRSRSPDCAASVSSRRKVSSVMRCLE